MKSLFIKMCMIMLISITAIADPTTGTPTGDPTGGDGGGGNGALQQINARFIDKLGEEFYFNDDTAHTYTNVWVPLKSQTARMAANFFVEPGNRYAAITFTAEAWADRPSTLMIRLLVDGQPMQPGWVPFASGMEKGTRAFTFIAEVQEGMRTVEVEWKSNWFGSSIRDASLTIRQGSPNNLVTEVAEGSSELAVTQSGQWRPIPRMNGFINVTEPATLTASLSSAARMVGDGSMDVRCLINGIPTEPEYYFLTDSDKYESQKTTFGQFVQPGLYHVEFQWRTTAWLGGAEMAQRTMELTALPEEDKSENSRSFLRTTDKKASGSGDTGWKYLSYSKKAFWVPENGQIVAQLSAETFASPVECEMRMLIDDVPVDGSLITIRHGDRNGVHAFNFVAKNLNVGQVNPLVEVKLQWRIKSGSFTFGRRALNYLVYPGGLPDLSEPGHFSGNEIGVEPAFGKRRVLTIIVDTGKEDVTLPSFNTFKNFLWHNTKNISDYFEANSLGRIEVENVATLGYITLDESYDYYWNTDNDIACDVGDVYKTGHSRRRAEILTKVAQMFDLEAYDFNGDGFLDSHSELGILIVNALPNDDGTNRALDIMCDGSMFSLNGLEFNKTAEANIIPDESNWNIVAHELGHLLFDLGDQYTTALHNYQPGKYSLMDNDLSKGTTWIDAINRLWLGWVNPIQPKQGGNMSVGVADQTGDVLIIPRKNMADGKEYFLVEYRNMLADNVNYDERFEYPKKGLLIWHAVQDKSKYDIAPECTQQNTWNGVNQSVARRGIRLFKNYNGNPFSNNVTIDDQPDQACGAGLWEPSLIWADGVVSGRTITNVDLFDNMAEFFYFGNF